MSLPTKRQLLVPLVVLTVILAGCAGGGGGGDGGDGATATATPTDAPTTQQGGDRSTTMADTTTQGGDGSTTTAETTAGDGGDGGDGGDATTTDSQGTTTGSGELPFSAEKHVTAIKRAGSYTAEYTIQGLMGGGGSQSSKVSGIEKVIIGSNEKYAKLTTTTQGQSFDIEYYSPPNTDKTYQHMRGRTQEVSGSNAFFFNLTSLDSTATGEEFPQMEAAGTGQTALGPANKYVVTSMDALGNTTNYGEVTDFKFVVYVDKDTGVIAKYDYRVKYVQDGEEGTVRMTFEITSLGSTTIEPPEWAP